MLSGIFRLHKSEKALLFFDSTLTLKASKVAPKTLRLLHQFKMNIRNSVKFIIKTLQNAKIAWEKPQKQTEKIAITSLLIKQCQVGTDLILYSLISTKYTLQ